MLSPPFYGLKVITNDTMEKRRRTWRERLFTLPWQPLKKIELIPLLKDGQVLKHGDMLVMNSKTRNDLINAIGEQNA